MSQVKSIDVGRLAYLTDEAFVHHCFVYGFRRVCSPVSAKRYIAELSGGVSRVDVVRKILGEDEFAHRIDTAALRRLPELEGEQFLREAYRRFLGRSIDQSGLEYYSERLESGYAKVAVLKELSSSTEGKARRADHPELEEFITYLGERSVNPALVRVKDVESLLSKCDREFVLGAYRLMLGREADAEGLAAYQSALLKGASKLRLLRSLAYSNEGRRIGRPLSVRLYLMAGRFFF